MASDSKQGQDTIKQGGIVGFWNNLSRNNPNFSSLASTAIIFIAMVVVLSIVAPRFLTARNITNILTQSAAYLIMAVGMTFVLTTGGIDISLGSMIGLTTAVMGRFIVEQGNSWILGVLLALVFGLLLGLWNGLFVVKFTVPSIIVTIGSMTMFRGMAYAYIEGQIFYGYPEGFLFLARGRLLGIPMAVYIAFAVFVIGLFVMDHTKLGRHITALGGNEEAARLAGIPVKLLRLAVFANMGMLTGLATVILTARLGSSEATAGMGMEIHVIAAVVLGGTVLSGGRGLMFGSLLGVLILALLENGLLLAGVSFFMQRVLLGLIFILVVAVRSMRDKTITTAT